MSDNQIWGEWWRENWRELLVVAVSILFGTLLVLVLTIGVLRALAEVIRLVVVIYQGGTL